MYIQSPFCPSINFFMKHQSLTFQAKFPHEIHFAWIHEIFLQKVIKNMHFTENKLNSKQKTALNMIDESHVNFI